MLTLLTIVSCVRGLQLLLDPDSLERPRDLCFLGEKYPVGSRSAPCRCVTAKNHVPVREILAVHASLELYVTTSET